MLMQIMNDSGPCPSNRTVFSLAGRHYIAQPINAKVPYSTHQWLIYSIPPCLTGCRAFLLRTIKANLDHAEVFDTVCQCI